MPLLDSYEQKWPVRARNGLLAFYEAPREEGVADRHLNRYP